ncbi:helix-turn-helix domain-containing protein [Streptomyces sp. NPDC051684]|uniref:helix-turn-helix domain-containing protein n=1 Tax=Streptomyces sp. NPDC051684 TaxID=3365670 RepID=UPI00378F5D42
MTDDFVDTQEIDIVRPGRHTHPAAHTYLLGRRLREIRQEQGVPLGQAAAAAGVSRLWAAQIEGGETLDLETMGHYAKALGARITVTVEHEPGADRPTGLSAVPTQPQCGPAT